MKHTLLSLLLLILSVAAIADDSGTCGENVTYAYVSDTHTLTISGSGAMASYDNNNMPWNSYKKEVQKVAIDNGVTSIGDYAFYQCSGLTSVTIGNSVMNIGASAFSDCI